MTNDYEWMRLMDAWFESSLFFFLVYTSIGHENNNYGSFNKIICQLRCTFVADRNQNILICWFLAKSFKSTNHQSPGNPNLLE